MAGLDFDFDPFKSSDPFKGRDPFGGSSSQRQQRPTYRQPLGDEDSQSLGGKVLGAGVSGVSHVLGALDKPGQAARGLLAGKGLSSLKHLVPFSGTTGLTTEKDNTSGRDLTDMAGITEKGDKGWGAWGAGLAADIATDPLTYTTFGAKHALTGAGQAAEKTGALAGLTGRQTIAGGHSSLVRVGLPFRGPGVNIGTGRVAQGIAGAADTAGDFAKYRNPVGRAVGSLFNPAVHGAVDEITQRGATRYLDPALKALKQDARNDRFGIIQHLDPLVTANPANEARITDAARAVAEGVPHQFGPGMAADVQGAGQHARSVGLRQMSEAREAGAPLNDVADNYAGYVHRSSIAEAPGSIQLGGRAGSSTLLPNTSGANIGRDELFRNIPGGTNRINNWFDRFAGVQRNQRANANAIHADMVNDLQSGGNLLTYTPNVARQFQGKSAAVSRRLARASDVYRTTPDVAGRPFFSPDLVSDITQRGNQHAKTVANTRAAVGIMADNARAIEHGNPEGLVPLHDLANRLGLATTDSDAVTGAPMQGALVNLYRGLAQHGAGPVAPFLNGQRAPLAAAVNGFGLTPEHAEQLTKAYGKWAAPEQAKSTLGAFDSATNAFKSLAYPIWLSSNVRNAGTAFVNNLRHKPSWGDYAAQLQATTGRGARDLSAIHPSLAGLNPADQATQLRKLQYSSANIFGGNGMNDEIAGNVQNALAHGQRFTPQVPGSDRAGTTGSLLGDTADLTLRQGLLGSLTNTGRAISGGVMGLTDPTRHWGQSIAENLGIKGVGGAAADTLPAVAAGRKFGTNIEDFFRGALWNKMARSGNTPSQAGDAVNRLHFDYDKLTGFEKNVMRRAMPFYTYARKNLPLQLDTISHQPGILQAQSKPFNQSDPDGKGYVPKYLDSGYAMGLGPEKDGQRQYVSKLGLPGEEAFEKMHFRNGVPDLKRTALSYLGGMNPLIKAPLEQLFDTQFHTQRKLSDLKAPAAASALGKMWSDENPQLLSQIMANSPLTRFVSSADKLMDPRKSWAQKALNLGTGVKVTDVDTDKQRAIDTRQALQDLMATHPNFSRYSSFYVKPEDVNDLTPEEIQLMGLYATQQAASKEYAKTQRRVGVQQ